MARHPAAPIKEAQALVEIKHLGLAALSCVPLETVDAERREALLDTAFGADRHQRTAYRCRTGTAMLPGLSLALCDADDALIGLIQCWPVALERDDGVRVPLIMVGPVAVDPARQRGGHGRTLMAAMLERAAAPGVVDGAMMLIGDPEYYDRFFGFSAAHTAGWTLPGPFEPRRLLARACAGHAVPDGAGRIVPDPR